MPIMSMLPLMEFLLGRYCTSIQSVKPFFFDCIYTVCQGYSTHYIDTIEASHVQIKTLEISPIACCSTSVLICSRMSE